MYKNAICIGYEVNWNLFLDVLGLFRRMTMYVQIIFQQSTSLAVAPRLLWLRSQSSHISKTAGSIMLSGRHNRIFSDIILSVSSDFYCTKYKPVQQETMKKRELGIRYHQRCICCAYLRAYTLSQQHNFPIYTIREEYEVSNICFKQSPLLLVLVPRIVSIRY